MSRKHYRALAEVLRQYGADLSTDKELIAWGRLCVEMGDVLATYNDRFSMSTWLHACTPYDMAEEVA